MRPIIKKLIKYFLISIVGSIVILILINLYIILYSNSHIHTEANSIKHTDVGLILGASVKGDTLSHVLKDRVDSAIELYNKGKFQIFLVSGDNGTVQYNEVVPIRKYLLKKGIPAERIYLDYAGFDTYDSMYRAKEIFEVQNMIVFTQKFHLNRSVYIARRLGINAEGYQSDLHVYKFSKYYNLREFFSRIKAFGDVEILKSKPKFLGEKIEIFY